MFGINHLFFNTMKHKNFFLLFLAIFSSIALTAMERRYNFHTVYGTDGTPLLFRSGIIRNMEDYLKIIDDHRIERIIALTHLNEEEEQRLEDDEGVSWKFLAIPARTIPTLKEMKKVAKSIKKIYRLTYHVHD